MAGDTSMCHGHRKSGGVTNLGHTTRRTPMCQLVCATRPVDMPVCLDRVKPVRYTDLNLKGTSGTHGSIV